MVESIPSTVASAALVRTTDQASAAQPRKVPVIQAPYISPYIHIDNEKNKAMLQIRNGQTGAVIEQISGTPAIIAENAKAAAAAKSDAPAVPAPQSAPSTPNPTPSGSSASFGAFARQIAAAQTAVIGAGGTVSLLA